MAEEFDNYQSRMEEAHRAVERWEAEGGAGADEGISSSTGTPSEPAPGVRVPEEGATSRTESDRD